MQYAPKNKHYLHQHGQEGTNPVLLCRHSYYYIQLPYGDGGEVNAWSCNLAKRKLLCTNGLINRCWLFFSSPPSRGFSIYMLRTSHSRNYGDAVHNTQT